MDSGGGYLYEPDHDMATLLKQEQKESRHAEKLDEAYIQVMRKFRKRVEQIGGYEHMSELWQDLAPIILQTIHLKSPVQRLLTYTSDFHEFCQGFHEDTSSYKTYFDAMDFAWCCVLDTQTTETEKVRIVNVLSDGQDIANKLGLHDVYPHALEKADDEL
ncbi:uncharacterized protein B0P05DRAFT_574234 [Gilbertella persicaria]|uniref:uncharacterized protein n=1 Tax=Gilbertella persicaria TaxID=101096 RepID=UPI00221EB2C9|nr:uncharacterized protein B0P05DRAFT_574234 [Gilbertella persicaria]KAI8063668.1 hypothetical protein B0P05DRAFT_574234 [Gilbertella persicaria]